MYHPWCIGEHVGVPTNYVVPFCEGVFTINWYATWGCRLGNPKIFKQKCMLRWNKI